ncbi:hypothetical protein E6C64_05865 [Naasia lichenicola]|uniref:Alpha/beta hydrolase domain-containing protein n=2 Tax=Naasia lichenicola TaxID=2565933 RepID=A0A4V3WTD9_9MICO|nr:hypothetical protein E6C64_05865 [Naasia lichenicola]
MRGGHTWVGVTVFPSSARLLREDIDPDRYASLEIAEDGLQYDVLGSAISQLIQGSLGEKALGGARADRVLLSGMSATGSFTRIFLQEGFHERWTRSDGRALIDGYLIGISSGGAGAAGYPPLSADDHELSADDPRRTVRGHGAVVFEVLSETEAETHQPVTRPDSDEAGDRYRLYEIAGTAHIEARPSVLTNLEQFERGGGSRPAFDVQEARSDARFDVYLRGAFEAMDRWIAAGEPAPRAECFTHVDGAEELQRDADGNVLGGVRAPWLDVPTAVYSPHSTSSPESEPPPPWMPFGDPEMLAWLVGSMRLLPLSELRRRYGNRSAYLRRFAESVAAERARGLLLDEEARELLREAPSRWRG